MASRPKTTGVGRRVARVSQGVRTGQTSEVTQRASAVDIVSALSSPPSRPSRTHKSLLSEYSYPVLRPLQEKPASLAL